MAWLDDRIWCHPKVADLSNAAFRAYVNGIAYSSGFDTAGLLTAGQQRQIGSDAKTRRELLAAGLWDDVDGKTIQVHDWDEHNGKRDERRRADRERKRRAYWQEKGMEPPAETPRRNSGESAGETRGVAHVDARAGARPMTGDRVTDKGTTGPTGLQDRELSEGRSRAHQPHDDEEPLVTTTERPPDHTHIKTTIDQSLGKAAR